ncbi:MAG: hypothetical protein PGN13_04580 [Patulibacter minatonensis]
MSPSRVPSVPRSRRALIAIAAASASLGFGAASASAASVALKITDPAGDSTAGSALDITSATLTQDTTKGTVSAVVNFAAAPSKTAVIAIGLGKTVNGECSIGQENDGSLTFLVLLESNTAIWASQASQNPNSVTPVVTGSSFKVATAANSTLKKFAWNCGLVSIQQPTESGDSVGDTATGSGTGAGGGQVVVLTDKPDGDKDGVPDVADACPTVAGSSANGCLSIAAKLAYRLGAKRVAVDVLVKRTGTTCKPVAKAAVKDGKKTIGKANLDVGVHGAFCHISGDVKIKKHGKKVKLTISGTGFKKISKTVKK